LTAGNGGSVRDASRGGCSLLGQLGCSGRGLCARGGFNELELRLQVVDACVEHGVTRGGLGRRCFSRGPFELGTHACGFLLCGVCSARRAVCIRCLSVSNELLFSQPAGKSRRLFKRGVLQLGKLAVLSLERLVPLFLLRDGGAEGIG